MSSSIKERLIAERELDDAKNAHEEAGDRYLRACGWVYSCATLGSLWSWDKEINGVKVATTKSMALSIEAGSSDICEACNEPECMHTDGGEGPCVFVARILSPEGAPDGDD